MIFFSHCQCLSNYFHHEGFSSLFSERLLLPVEPMIQTIGYHGVAKCRGFSFSSFKWGNMIFIS